MTKTKRSPIEIALDGVTWNPVESQYGPASGIDELPNVTHTGILRIGDCEIEVVQLDDGQRLITEDGLRSFMKFLNGDQ